ncbi:hypothetical protein G7046_g1984 [Stylonectria norvegica]|nr:hypothetical protein G7046_g1984 [Stylonectria norvegica]
MYEEAGIKYALPWLGLRDGAKDSFREHLSSLSTRLELAKSWLDECLKSHQSCAPAQSEMPRRLLEISTSSIRLLEYQYPDARNFAALSYSWGPTGNLKTLRSNIESHINGILIETLPRTLADAVHASRALGLQHIWIDSLCIVQDDPDDWESQIPLMSSIYSGATVVIAAQASSSVHDGCLQFGPASNAPLTRTEVAVKVNGAPRKVKLSIQEENTIYHHLPGHHSSRPVGDNDVLLPLSARAWAFQERFLASRILFCTASEFSWQCSAHTRCECDSEPRISVANLYGDYLDTGQLATIVHTERESPSAPLKKLGLWCDIVQQFSSRELSVWTDRLPAIQGIVEALSKSLPDTFKIDDYLFGIWRPFLLRSLSWHRNTLGPAFPTAAPALVTYGPSWSWVGCPAAVDYYSQEWDAEAITLTEIISVDVEHSSSMGAFGPGSGRLTISGSIIPVTRHEDPYIPGIFYQFPKDFDGTGNSFFEAPTLEMELDNPFDLESCEAVTHFLPLIRSAGSPVTQGIFLTTVPDADGLAFRRVGYAYDFACVIPWLEVDSKPFNQTVVLV